MSDFHHDNDAKLLVMAGQIADFYKSHPLDEAATEIAGHINKFWTPGMREDFLNAAQGQKLEPPALEAARAQVRRRKAEAF